MIIYFSGTGNSRYTAELINSEISDKILCLNDAVNTGFRQKFNSDKPFVIVCPTLSLIHIYSPLLYRHKNLFPLSVII